MLAVVVDCWCYLLVTVVVDCCCGMDGSSEAEGSVRLMYILYVCIPRWRHGVDPDSQHGERQTLSFRPVFIFFRREKKLALCPLITLYAK